VIKKISLPGNYEGVYTFIINSSETIPGTNVEWHFVVEDIEGNVTYGEVVSSRVYFITSLQVFPPLANGRNGWYITEPQFEIINSDAEEINYRWNGLYYTYSSPFGLEGTPNNGNITGGTLVLYYRSRYPTPQCQESERQFTGKFDFRDPRIEDLIPRPGAVVSNQNPIIIRAHIDEVYQGNSGVNISSVVMKIDGQLVPIFVNASRLDADVVFMGILSNGEHEVNIYAEDYSGRNSSKTWRFELIDPVELDIFVNLPSEGIYMSRRLPFNITLTKEAEKLSYVNYADSNPIQKMLCRNCKGFGHTKTTFKSLREGENLLIFRAEDKGKIVEKNVSLIIDSESPKIIDTAPKSGLASGLFEIEFEEKNPFLLEINYGNYQIGFLTQEIKLSSDCQQRNAKYYCSAKVNLSDYDGNQIEYYFFLEDLAGNHQVSRARKLEVDISPPAISSFDFEVNGEKVVFSLEVEEPYLDKITFIDLMDSNPRETVLCNALQDNSCIKQVSLREGDHNITVIVRDVAGNVAKAYASFFTDSRIPKIKRTEPTKGFSSGELTVIFEEVNPYEMYLTYGTFSKQRYAKVNLTECIEDKKNNICKTSINLSEFEGESIFYKFNLTDRAGNFAESKSYTLSVDTLAPTINEFNYTIKDREVSFTIGLEDVNFDKILYLDRKESNPRFLTLCSKLSNGLCKKTKRFSSGDHSLEIIAIDKAGNEASVTSGLIFTI